jgi:glucokinase
MTESRSEFYVGLDLGGTTISAALIDGERKLQRSLEAETRAAEGHMAVISRMAGLTKDIIRQAGIPPADVRATGVGLPGVLDLEKGEVVYLPNLPGRWPHVPVESLLAEQLGVPVYIVNDVRALTLGEKTFGAGRHVKNMVCLAIGTGIGGGVVVNGSLYLGNGGTAGEGGHQTILPDGPRCGCGNYGCLEAVASGPAIAAMGMKAVSQGLTTSIRELAQGDLNEITPELIARAAIQGDEIAQRIYEQAGRYIGIAISNLIVVLTPQMVVVGGGVARAGDLLMSPIRETVRERVLVTPVEKVQIVFAELGTLGGAMGAAEWARLRLAGFEVEKY